MIYRIISRIFTDIIGREFGVINSRSFLLTDKSLHPVWYTKLQDDTLLSQRSAYAPGSLANLRSHLRSYFMFCIASGHSHLECSIDHICNFLVFLSRTLSFVTIRNYLSSLRIFFELHGINVDLPKDFYIALTLRGIKRLHGSQTVSKLPITPDILIQMHRTINFASITDRIFWTAALFAFFTFFRKSNLFPSSAKSFDPLRNLTRQDISIFPSFALVTVHWSKTLQFQERKLSVPIPRVPGSILCPVAALEDYFTLCPAPSVHPYPLFCTFSGSAAIPFLYPSFLRVLKSKLVAIGIDPTNYSGHSFRRGGASFAFALRIPSELIQQQGDWHSDAYLRYLDKPLSQRLKVAFAFKHALQR